MFVVDVVEDVGGELVVSENRVLALEFELEVLCAASLCSRKMAFFERFVMSRLIYQNNYDLYISSNAHGAHLDEPLPPIMVRVQLDVERLEDLHDRVPGPDRPWACQRLRLGVLTRFHA